MTIIACSFSGALVDLKGSQRTADNALRVLSKSPRVSCFDFSENAWAWRLVNDLRCQGLIVDVPAEYPWCRYALTDAGRERLKELEVDR